MSTLRRSSSSYGGFADGIIIRGVPLLTLYPGNIYWVDSAGGGGSKGTFNHPCLTLAAAHDLCTTDNGDIIVMKPGHAETPTATIDFSKNGFAIIGLGFGDNRPTFTNGITAAGDDVFDFAGDDIVVYNMKWKEAAPAGSSVVVFNVSGDNFHIENCYIELGAKTLTFLTHDTTTKTGLTVINNTIVGTAAGPDVGIRIEKGHTYARISGNRWLVNASAGVDSGIIIFVSGTTNCGMHMIDGDVWLGAADNDVYLLQTDVQIYSLMQNVRGCVADASIGFCASTAGGFGWIDNKLAEPGKVGTMRPVTTTVAI